MSTKDEITIGIDNGMSGGIVVLFNGCKVHAYSPLFTQPCPGGNELNILKLDAWVHSVLTAEQLQSATFFVERPVGSIQAWSAASMSGSFHSLRTWLDLRRFRWQRITPQSWQLKLIPAPKKSKEELAAAKAAVQAAKEAAKAAGKKYKKVRKDHKSSKDGKIRALTLANTLFPGNTWLTSAKKKVPHDGVVDAALIAAFGYREKSKVE